MSVTDKEADIRSLLSAARKAQKAGKTQEAEYSYQQAIEIAERMFGKNTASVGLVLLDLIQFYQLHSYRHPAKLQVLHERIRDILASYAHRDQLVLPPES